MLLFWLWKLFCLWQLTLISCRHRQHRALQRAELLSLRLQQMERWQWLLQLDPAKHHHLGKQDQGLIPFLILWNSNPYPPQECCNHQVTRYYQEDGSILWANPVHALDKEKQEFRYCLCLFLYWLSTSSSLAKGASEDLLRQSDASSHSSLNHL